MYEFLDRLITIALPRVRDFRGVSPKSFDGRGNYALGLKEQIVFPEIDYDKIDEVRGHGHHHRDDGQDATRKPRAFCRASTCRSEAEGHESAMAKTSAIEKNNRRRKPGEAARGQARCG